jgi:Holliday junction DNA helicase RuvA
MISRLRGVPVGNTPEGLVIDVGGVGYAVAATPSAIRKADAARSGGEVVIETYLHVREDTLQLYGFGEPSERELFSHLLGVSGIGPKVALAVVSSGSPAELRRAIVVGDPARLQAIPGIGKKTAERIVLELKGSIVDTIDVGKPAAPTELVARDALVELGYTVVEAETALSQIDPELPAEERVRLALRKAA